MNTTIIFVIIALVALLVSGGFMYMNREDPEDEVPVDIIQPTLAPTTPAPPTIPPTTTPSPTPAAPSDTITLLYPQIVLPPAPPPSPTFLIVPGSNFPGVSGLKLDAATQNIATSFPRLVVRAVPYGSPIAYEVRRDRVTVLFDPFTKRVITARIG